MIESSSMAYFSAKPGPRPFYLTFSDVPEPWSELHALADRHRGAFAKAFAAAHARLLSGIDQGELVRAVAMGSAAHAEHALGLHRLDTYLLAELRPVYRRLFARAGELADRHLSDGRHESRAFADEVGISSQFDRTNQSAVDWIERNVGVLVRDISTAQRRMLVQMVNDAFTQGVEPARLARQIRERIGLTATQQGYVTNYRAQLEARGNIKDDWVDKLVGRYQDNWVKYRAMTIARTETIRTAVAGQQELWNQSVTTGRIDPVEYEQLWIITPDDLTCEECRDYNGARAPIGGAFFDGVAGPPLHPRCRCAVGLVAIASTRKQQAVPDMAAQGPSKLIPRIPQSAMVKGASEYGGWWANEVWRDARYRTLEAMGFYSPDQERDEQGRWTAGGGGDSAKQQESGKVGGSSSSAPVWPTSSHGVSLAPGDVSPVIQRMMDDPKVQAAELATRERGDARNDKGVMENGQYTAKANAENQRIAQSFLSKAAIAKPGEKPVAVVMLGRPGSGKSSLLEALGNALPKTVGINPDDVQAKLPGYTPQLAGAYHYRAADIVEQHLMPAAIAGRYNIALDVTGAHPEKMATIAAGLQAKGYEVHVIAAHVPPDVSNQRVHDRFLSTGRYVAPYVIANHSFDHGPDQSYENMKSFAASWRQYDTSTRPAKLMDEGKRK